MFRSHLSEYSTLVLTERGPSHGQGGVADQLNKLCALKPRGFWYGIDDAWLRREGRNAVGMYEYEVTLGNATIIRLTSRAEVGAFTCKFKGAETGVAWEVVAREADGVELAAYDIAAECDFAWYGMWDGCTVGVIWRPEKITLTLLRKVTWAHRGTTGDAYRAAVERALGRVCRRLRRAAHC
jgi:hypothetical protein